MTCRPPSLLLRWPPCPERLIVINVVTRQRHADLDVYYRSLSMHRLLFPPFLAGRSAVGLLVLRLVAGTAMAFHGWPKIQHATSWMGADAAVPGVLQALAAIAEFGGGICWVLGLLTPLAS